LPSLHVNCDRRITQTQSVGNSRRRTATTARC
jgi:hypothetical protein